MAMVRPIEDMTSGPLPNHSRGDAGNDLHRPYAAAHNRARSNDGAVCNVHTCENHRVRPQPHVGTDGDRRSLATLGRNRPAYSVLVVVVGYETTRSDQSVAPNRQ